MDWFLLVFLLLSWGVDLGDGYGVEGMELSRFGKEVELDSSGDSSLRPCCSEGRVVALNNQNPHIRKLLQTRNKENASPAPAPAHKGSQKKGEQKQGKSKSPAPAPISSPISAPLIAPVFPPSHLPGLSESPSPSKPPVSSPASSLTPSPAPTPTPMTVPPSQKAEHNPGSGAALPMFPSGSPSPSEVVDSPVRRATSWTTYVSIAAGVSFFLAISAVLFICCRANKVVTVRPWATGLSGQLQKAFVTGVPSLKRSELESACEDFSNIIGSLSDCMLYKGTLSSGVEIAVISSTITSRKDWSKQCESQFRKKITSLSKVNHKNFVNLLGYCEEEQPFTRMMVFEYAPNGTLFEHLLMKETEHLDWMTRLRISMGIAYCLEHIQQLRPPVVLRNLDSSTIYLTDDFAAKVSDLDFWTEAKVSDSATESSGPLALSSDPHNIVYQYGKILLEILSGKLFSEEDGQLERWASCYLTGEKPLIEMIDPSLKSFSEETVDALCEVVRSCINPDPKKRPMMADIAKHLRDITTMPPDGAVPKVSPLWWAELEIISAEAN
ncbi:inactive receptor-like serine/threonine-protein kinase At2g40270 [Typha angustifolia]|uniref:inactive receptor-like serine/threonine-protein kinase At2g40270 n=1 Tax=Typha angustifolia TaxID=59011 RepID=UPI003C2F2123